MLDFNDAKLEVSKDDILSKVSEFEIFKRYCKNFTELEIPFCSELRKDSNPSCNVYVNNHNFLRYKDFGNGDNLSCFEYVMKKFNCTFSESLSIIATDFNITFNKVPVSPELLIGLDVKPKIQKKIKSFIEIISQNWTLADFKYWDQYKIPLSLLEEYDVFSAKIVYLFKGDKRYLFEYSKSNPIFAYRFTNNGKYSYKVYRPLGDPKFKWLFSGGASEDIEGYDQLPLSGDVLILTKALKDVMCYKLIGYNAISLQGEHNILSQDLVIKLQKRFNKIIINYDNDDSGIKASKSLQTKFNFPIFIIPPESKTKDLSDYIKQYGLNKAQSLIDSIIKTL